MFSILLLSFSLLFSPALSYYPAKGVTTGGVQPRLEINQLYTSNQDQWNIFLLAMQKFMKAPDNDWDSYYAISTIHGAPHVAYDDSPPVQPRTGANTGYCFHNTQQFFLWHRPYMAIFEQAMVKNAVDIANNFSDPALRARYQKAASTLRMPYWDWASNSNVPTYISSYWAWIISPQNTIGQWMPNPLYSYTFNDPSRSPIGHATTVRGQNYLDEMSKLGPSLRSWTALLFNTPNVCWNVFASNSGSESSTCPQGTIPQYIVSLESIHNAIHTTVCGDMCYFDTASFDPVFWLHHVNVDRLGALWQAINFNTWLIPTYSPAATFAQAVGVLGPTTPLYPFRSKDSAQAWWTNDAVRDIKTFGYTYPEIQQAGGVAGQALASSVQAKVNALYGVGRTLQALTTGSGGSARKQTSKARVQSAAKDSSARALSIAPSLEDLEQFKDILVSADGSFPDYVARVSINRGSVPISFMLNLYFGSTDAANRIGSVSMLSQANAPEKNIKADIPFTDALLNKLVSKEIKSLDTEVVKAYSEANIKWKAVGGDGKDYGGDVKVTIVVVRNTVLPHNGPDLPPAVAPGAQLLNVTGSW